MTSWAALWVESALCMTLEYCLYLLFLFFFLLRKACLAGMLFHPDLSATVPMGSSKPSLWSHQEESAHVCKYGVWLLKPARTCPSNVPTLNIYQKWLFSGNRYCWAPSLQPFAVQPPPCHWVWGFLCICRNPTVSQLQINGCCLRWSRWCFYLHSLIFAALTFTNYRTGAPEGNEMAGQQVEVLVS